MTAQSPPGRLGAAGCASLRPAPAPSPGRLLRVHCAPPGTPHPQPPSASVRNPTPPPQSNAWPDPGLTLPSSPSPPCSGIPSPPSSPGLNQKENSGLPAPATHRPRVGQGSALLRHSDRSPWDHGSPLPARWCLEPSLLSEGRPAPPPTQSPPEEGQAPFNLKEQTWTSADLPPCHGWASSGDVNLKRKTEVSEDEGLRPPGGLRLDRSIRFPALQPAEPTATLEACVLGCAPSSLAPPASPIGTPAIPWNPLGRVISSQSPQPDLRALFAL
ncbi:vegetative cell wall protein gp1-like [Molossus molossus]|uniref:vegetative cell wall protein gp1-like n=1 Tax=Molossus molossus TaxID=27622 RepID=UPI001746ADAA|nr:vegetative cell wall protein gp1-like [Molossus molossus]